MEARRALAFSLNDSSPYRAHDDDLDTRGLSVQYGYRAIVRNDGRDDRFFGIFFASKNIVAFVLQLLVVGRLLSRLGVAAGLAILPLVRLSSSIAFLLFPRLLTATLIKTADDGLSNSVNKSSVEVLYLPISLAVKSRSNLGSTCSSSARAAVSQASRFSW